MCVPRPKIISILYLETALGIELTPAVSTPRPYHPDTGRGNFSSAFALTQYVSHGVVAAALLKGEEK